MRINNQTEDDPTIVGVVIMVRPSSHSDKEIASSIGEFLTENINDITDDEGCKIPIGAISVTIQPVSN